jgi:hypothetical protein
LTEVHIKAPESGLTIPGGNQRQVIATVPFPDSRQIRDRCGVQKGGYGNETASAVCQGDPARWIAELLAGELKASGFTHAILELMTLYPELGLERTAPPSLVSQQVGARR